jgi:UDP-N-acetylglucosamine 2-epimerase
MATKKLNLKNQQKWDLAKLENSFLILTDSGGILSLRQVCFF